MTKWWLTAIAAVVLSLPAAAQTGDLVPLRVGDYYINIATPHVLPARMWEIRFTHRFSEPINRGDAHSLWGLDSGADVGIGVAWAPTDKLQASLFRTNLLDDVELAGKYSVVEQSPNMPLSGAVRAGIDWRTQEGLDHRVSPFVQVLLARQLGRRAELFAAPTYIIDDPLFDSAFNVPVGAAITVRPGVFVIAELIPENRDVDGAAESDLFWSLGLKAAWGGHFFEVSLSDSRATHVDQYISSAPLGGIDRGDIHLGFNIERRFGGRKK
jgi:hypothetical protein